MADCVCIGGVNYTKACSCKSAQCCGSCCVAMSSVNANPSVSQAGCKNDCGGASSVTASLNAIGKWGTVLTGILQGKPVATNKSGVAVGAKGSTTLSSMSSNSLIIILVIVAALLFVAMRK